MTSRCGVDDRIILSQLPASLLRAGTRVHLNRHLQGPDADTMRRICLLGGMGGRKGGKEGSRSKETTRRRGNGHTRLPTRHTTLHTAMR